MWSVIFGAIGVVPLVVAAQVDLCALEPPRGEERWQLALLKLLPVTFPAMLKTEPLSIASCVSRWSLQRVGRWSRGPNSD